MPEFPYQAVYDHFAKPLVEMGLQGYETLPPLMAVVLTIEGELAAVDLLPIEPIGKFFASSHGKDTLGAFIRMTVASMPDDACLVLVSEAYMRETKLKEEVREMNEKGLTNDPKAVEVVMIKVFRKEDTRIGTLRINADRSLEYSPLQDWKNEGGRLSTNPDKSDIL